MTTHRRRIVSVAACARRGMAAQADVIYGIRRRMSTYQRHVIAAP